MNPYNIILQPPTAFIDKIQPNPAKVGEPISFMGHGIDVDGEVIEYDWTSSIDGFLSSKRTFTASSLSYGTHTIYFKVRNDDGLWSPTAQVNLTVRSEVPWIAACDETGYEKNVFDPSEDVYILGGNYPVETNVTIYVIPDNRSTTPTNAIATSWTVTNSYGELPLTLTWNGPLVKGDYDVWIDVNQNGVYDELDVYDDSALDVYAFSVIPEFTSLASMLLVFLIFTVVSMFLKKDKKQKPP